MDKQEVVNCSMGEPGDSETGPIGKTRGGASIKIKRKKKMSDIRDKKWTYKSGGYAKESGWAINKCPGRKGLFRSGASNLTSDVEGAKFICDACGQGFKWKRELTMHQRIKITKICESCGMGFSTTNALDRHERRTHPGVWDKKWSCEVEGCNYLVWGLKEMDEHLKNEHEDIGSRKGEWRCEVCGKGYFHKTNLALHLGQIHKYDKKQLRLFELGKL